MNTLSKSALLLLGLIGTSLALCPGEVPCSGHGTCGANDKCSCFPTWTVEADCSLRSCPYDKSWVANSDGVAHGYAECSDKGTCDRSVGLCECNEGYEGNACQRMSCPENCSGHGECQTLYEIDSSYSAWDAHMVQHCVCDPGFEGTICQHRMCKVGDDPLTTGQTSTTYTITETSPTGEFVLVYTDWRGETWKTFPLTLGTSLTAVAIEEALEALPNGAIDSVTVTHTSGTIGTDAVWTIEFDSVHTPGAQTLTTGEDACTTNGCQPYFDGVTGGSLAIASTTGTREKTVCSGRGMCDSESGLCQCYPGYTGEMCHIQTVIT